MNNIYLRFSQISGLTGLKRHTINARAKSIFNEEELKRSSSKQILLNPHQIREIIKDRLLLSNNQNKIIYVGNLKGGVGKTSLSYLIANTLSTLGLKTCLIDLDVQANLTRQYINIGTNHPVFYDIIDNKKNISEVIENISSTLDLIPSSLKNSLIQKALSMQSPKHHLTWFNSICLNHLRNNYNVVVVDTPPHLTTLNAVFCLCLKNNDNILIPVCAEDFSIMGVQMFLDDILEIRRSYGIEENVEISIIMNRFFQNQKTNLEMLIKMGQFYGDMLSEIVIRDNAKIREIINNKILLHEIKQGKEIYEIISSILKELGVLKNCED